MRLTKFSPRFWVALAIFAVIFLFGFLGPYLFPGHTPTKVAGGLYDPPSGNAWLGTDHIGQDVFGQLVYGTRTSLIVGLLGGAVAVVVGVLIGTLAGYIGGWVEEALMAFTNVIVAIPQIVVLILISIALNSRSAVGVGLVIAVTSWPWTARATRAQASSVRVREHLDVARLSGSGPVGMILYDVLPYMLSYVVMAFVLQMSSAILTEAALSLLGLGPSNGVSLGIMLHWALAFESVRSGAWWAFIPPTVLLTLIAFILLMLQSSLDEFFNPRLRRFGVRLRKSARNRLAAPLPVPVPAGVPAAELAPQASAGAPAPADPATGAAVPVGREGSR